MEVIGIAQSKLDLMLHPVRMRIIQLLLGGRCMTAQELAEALGDVPPATLYRHLRKLTDADMLTVAEERPVRGAVERTYTLPDNALDTGKDATNPGPEELLRYFMGFQAGLQGEFRRYLQQEHFDLVADGVSFRRVDLYLTDAEFQQLITTIAQALVAAIPNGPGPERRRRTFANIIIPEPDPVPKP
jgi:DNA-binding transcriptional ArsR family regulator